MKRMPAPGSGLTVLVAAISLIALGAMLAAPGAQAGLRIKTEETETGRARNVVLLIGDGMGIAHVTAARIWAHGSPGRLNMESLPVTGFCTTHSSSDYVTDSAASGTAISCGAKTSNGAIGWTDPKIDPSGTSRPLQNICQLAAAAGKATGVVSTARVTHATPAVFFAHVTSRDNEAEIAAQLGDSPLQVALGGGRGLFYPPDMFDPETGAPCKGLAGRVVADELAADGWAVVHSAGQLGNIDPATDPRPVLGLFEMSHMNYEADRAEDKLGEPSLAEMTEFAIRRLAQDPDGFFLMVEAARIDHASHANDARRAIADTIAFDQAVARARELCGEDTLIIVTADHETGGLALNGYTSLAGASGDDLLAPIGQGEHARGLIAWGSGPSGADARPPAGAPADFPHKSAYAAPSATHTAVDVPVMAEGPGAERFAGFIDNVDIATGMAAAMGLRFDDPANLAVREAMARGALERLAQGDAELVETAGDGMVMK